MSSYPDFRPIILAGGSGTRFWPRSRKARAKQVLALDGERGVDERPLAQIGHVGVARHLRDTLSAGGAAGNRGQTPNGGCCTAVATL